MDYFGGKRSIYLQYLFEVIRRNQKQNVEIKNCSFKAGLDLVTAPIIRNYSETPDLIFSTHQLDIIGIVTLKNTVQHIYLIVVAVKIIYLKYLPN